MSLLVAFVNENVNNGRRQFYFIEVLRAEGLDSKQKFNVVPCVRGSKNFESNKLIKVTLPAKNDYEVDVLSVSPSPEQLGLV